MKLDEKIIGDVFAGLLVHVTKRKDEFVNARSQAGNAWRKKEFSEFKLTSDRFSKIWIPTSQTELYIIPFYA